MRVTLRIPLAWTSLLAFFFACAVACVVAWFILLSTICSNPRTPVPQTQHVIPYNCHGMKVFISPSQDARLHWLVPVGLLCIVLSLAAATMVVQAVAKAWQSDVRGRHHAEHVRIFAVPGRGTRLGEREVGRPGARPGSAGSHFDQQTY